MIQLRGSSGEEKRKIEFLEDFEEFVDLERDLVETENPKSDSSEVLSILLERYKNSLN